MSDPSEPPRFDPMQLIYSKADASRYLLQQMKGRVAQANKKEEPLPDKESLERMLYEIRDEWCTATGEWDASKMPVSEQATRLEAKLKGPKAAKRTSPEEK